MYRFFNLILSRKLYLDIYWLLLVPFAAGCLSPRKSGVLVNTPDRFLYIRSYSQSAHNLNSHLNLLDLNSTLNFNIKPQRTQTWMHSHLHLQLACLFGNLDLTA